MKKDILNMERRRREDLKKDIMMKIIKDIKIRKDTSLIIHIIQKEAKKVENMEAASMVINMVVMVVVIINSLSAKL
jgi:hypothetical protein